MNEAGNAKQQIVERIKNSTNILVTLSTNPSVDELSAALGLTLMLNKLEKHATAVVSGAIPPAIAFLDPSKTFESTVNSLRDFIIALDKEKADHLRYKVDGDVVKIFITPYRTTITNEDLQFSQGDYNVELVLALDVKNKDHLDAALSAHGKILHDATVATITAGETVSDLGSIDWHEDNASSVSEMLVSLSEALKGDKPLLDNQTATAFLTGIVAATDRFSNNHTSSRVMTMAAQLMAAGANQQLIASKLEEAHEINRDAPTTTDGTTELAENTSTKLTRDTTPPAPVIEEVQKPDDGSLQVTHDAVDEIGDATVVEQQERAAKEAEDLLAQQLQAATTTPSVAPMPEQLQQNLTTDPVVAPPAAQPLRGAVHSSVWQSEPSSEPSMGGTLNATTEEAADETRREEEEDRNRTILSHGAPAASMSTAAPSFNPSFSEPPASEPLVITPPSQTLADIDAQNRGFGLPEDHARAAVEEALRAAPEVPTLNPFATDALTQPPVAKPFEPVAPPVAPELPPMPDFSTLPPLPPLPSFEQPTVPPTPFGGAPDTFTPPTIETPTPPPSTDPGQFKIPGQ